MARKRGTEPVTRGLEVQHCDLGQLSRFLGERIDAMVMARMKEAGLGDLRASHVRAMEQFGDRVHGAVDLAGHLGVSHARAWKVVHELAERGYIDFAPAPDERVRTVELSKRGLLAAAQIAALRAEVHGLIHARWGAGELASVRDSLAQALEGLGGRPGVRGAFVEARKVGPTFGPAVCAGGSSQSPMGSVPDMVPA